MAASHRETILGNTVRKARQQTTRVAASELAAFVISARQHDPLTAWKLIEKPFAQGIELQDAKEPVVDGDVTYPAGSTIIPLAQPKMGLIRALLERTHYPDNAWTHPADGGPVSPSDAATDTFAEFMGCEVRPLGHGFTGRVEKMWKIEPAIGTRSGRSVLGYLFDGRLNDSFAAANAFLHQGIELLRYDEAVTHGEIALPPGAFRATVGCEDAIDTVAQETGVPFYPMAEEPHAACHAVLPLRVGLYQRYWTGNIDEGWTRLLLERFGFPYSTLKDDAVRKGVLRESLDVLVIPHDDILDLITGTEKWLKDEHVPPEYRSGIGDEGVEATQAFVKGGGTLVLLNRACELAFENLGIRVENLLKDVPATQFLCPGSTLRARIDTRHPLAYGMPAEALLFCWDSPVFRIAPSPFNERVEVVASYPDSDLLQSGWLIGEEKIAGRPAMLSVRSGDGRVILYGFRPQHRAQTHGTFKLHFNALLGRAEVNAR